VSAPAHSCHERRWLVVLACLLVASVAVTYAPATGFESVSYDDPDYVFQNPLVRQGLTWEGLHWALTSRAHASNWHPLTWLSHMLDVELFGLDAGRHHRTSVALHALNGVLLLLALRALTGQLWPAALCAFLFALHPLRVESVAWISERKDLLAGTFFCLLLLCWARHARQGAWGGAYLGALALFALGLAAKPMLVSAPFVLLLLDAWPLSRIAGQRPASPASTATPSAPTPIPSPAPTHPGMTAGSRAGHRVWLEKLPLLLLAAGSCLVTLQSQKQGGALSSLESVPLGARIANAPLACLSYLGSFFWPSGLCYFYPHPALLFPERSPWSAGALGAALLLLALSGLALRQRRARPWLAVGWSWFLVMLLPVIGLVQVGEQARADRYAYLPLIGIQLALAWSALELAARRPRLRPLLAGSALAALLLLAGASRRQLAHWQDSEALYARAIAVSDGNYAARVGLANLRARAGDPGAARQLYEEALAIHPRYAPALYGLALLEQEAGRSGRALELYRAALASLPGLSAARVNMGRLLAQRGEVVEAALEFERVLELEPGQPDASFNLAQLLLGHGELEAARAHLWQAVAARPDFAAAWERLGATEEALGRHAQALDALRRAASAADQAGAARLLAWILATAAEDELRDGAEARRWAHSALAARARDPGALEALAAALAEQGDFGGAGALQEQALALLAPGEQAEARARLELYRAGRPFRHGH
jgi:tetratricopeptide (TPR) repeat protein